MAKRTVRDEAAMYRRVFGSEEGKEVMADLRKFCFGTQTTAIMDDAKRIDDKAMLIYEGRRQVLMQIVNMLKINFEDIYDYEEEIFDDDF